jgi:isoleucyl-tRNA synthetase
VLDVLFQALVRYAAPVLVFTAEEVWSTRFPDRGSVHLLEMHALPGEFANEALVAKYAALIALREAVTEAIEPLRREKIVRSGLEAEVTVPASAVPEGFSDDALAELFITATVRRGDGEGVTVTRTSDAKCGRCWRLLPEVTEDGALCHRCGDVVGEEELA